MEHTKLPSKYNSQHPMPIKDQKDINMSVACAIASILEQEQKSNNSNSGESYTKILLSFTPYATIRGYVYFKCEADLARFMHDDYIHSTYNIFKCLSLYKEERINYSSSADKDKEIVISWEFPQSLKAYFKDRFTLNKLAQLEFFDLMQFIRDGGEEGHSMPKE